MSKWRNSFSEAPVEQPAQGKDFARITEGKYVCSIEKARIDETGDSGARLCFGLVITDGEFSKRWLWANYSLEGDKLPKTKGLLISLGHNCTTPSEVEAACEALLFKTLQVTVKYNMGKDKLGNPKEYQNCYIDGLAEVAPF